MGDLASDGGPGQAFVRVEVDVVVVGVFGRAAFDHFGRWAFEVEPCEIGAGQQREGFAGDPGVKGVGHLLDQPGQGLHVAGPAGGLDDQPRGCLARNQFANEGARLR